MDESMINSQGNVENRRASGLTAAIAALFTVPLEVASSSVAGDDNGNSSHEIQVNEYMLRESMRYSIMYV